MLPRPKTYDRVFVEAHGRAGQFTPCEGLELVRGIKPRPVPYEGTVLPLYDTSKWGFSAYVRDPQNHQMA